MKWKNLLNDTCPKCSQPLYHDGGIYRCKNINCDFIITRPRLNGIKYEMENKFEFGKRNFIEGFGNE